MHCGEIFVEVNADENDADRWGDSRQWNATKYECQVVLQVVEDAAHGFPIGVQPELNWFVTFDSKKRETRTVEVSTS